MLRTFAFCDLCRRNVDNGGKGHSFTRGHQASVARFLGKAVKEQGAVKSHLTTPPVERSPPPTVSAAPLPPPPTFWCRFCNEEVHDVGLHAGRSALEHLVSAAHFTAVTTFLTRNITDKGKRDPVPYCVTDAQFQAHVAACARVTTASAAPTATAAAPVPEAPRAEVVTPKQRPDTGTRISGHGVVQNPTGMHDGKRVWGGGIMKLGAAWQPWAVDLLPDLPPPAPVTSLLPVAAAAAPGLAEPQALAVGPRGPSLSISVSAMIAKAAAGHEIPVDVQNDVIERQKAALRAKLLKKQGELARKPL